MLVPFVVSLNLHRRHLDSGQLAFVALAIESYHADRAKEAQRKAGREHGRGQQRIIPVEEFREDQKRMWEYSKSNPPSFDVIEDPKRLAEKHVQKVEQAMANRSITKAAEAVGTNRQYVSDAKAIRAKAPELEKEVMNGSLSLPQAKQAARLDEETRKNTPRL